MAHHVLAFTESLDAGGVLSYVAPAVDQQIRPVGNGIVVPAFNNLVGAAALTGATALHTKLVSPSLRARNPYAINPLAGGIVPVDGDSFPMFPQSPVALTVDEELDAQEDGNPAAAEQVTVLVFLAPGTLAPINGKIFTVAFSITCALVAGSWVYTPIALDDDLPVGVYDVVGAELRAATATAFRLVFVGGTLRPGAPCRQAIGHQTNEWFRYGQLNTWGSFQTVQPPSVEIISSAAAASATYVGVLDLIAH